MPALQVNFYELFHVGTLHFCMHLIFLSMCFRSKLVSKNYFVLAGLIYIRFLVTLALALCVYVCARVRVRSSVFPHSTELPARVSQSSKEEKKKENKTPLLTTHLTSSSVSYEALSPDLFFS